MPRGERRTFGSRGRARAVNRKTEKSIRSRYNEQQAYAEGEVSRCRMSCSGLRSVSSSSKGRKTCRLVSGRSGAGGDRLESSLKFRGRRGDDHGEVGGEPQKSISIIITVNMHRCPISKTVQYFSFNFRALSHCTHINRSSSANISRISGSHRMHLTKVSQNRRGRCGNRQTVAGI